MRALAILILPVLAIALFPLKRFRQWATLVVVVTACITSALAAVETATPGSSLLLLGYIRVDPTARLFLALVNSIYLGVSLYVWNRVKTNPILLPGAARFAAQSLCFLAASNTAILANHFVVLWIAVEVSTLSIAPLVIRDGVDTSRLASWRYLLFSSIALGLVYLGFVCLTHGMEMGGSAPTFQLDQLDANGASTSNSWGRLGLALILLGLGSKLGLAPMYSWLPEVYDEAPSEVTTLLGAVQFNVVLAALLRFIHIYRPVHAGLITYVLVTMGLVSMVISTFSLITTRNIKRLVAYASINHAGVIAIGLGIGKTASYGVLIYVISNAFTKAILFLTAGKIVGHYKTKDIRQISGLLGDLPYSGVFLMVGTFALLGFPPFGSFLGELLILSALIGSGHMLVFAAFCVIITITFIATGRSIFPMIWSEPKQPRSWPRQTMLSALPKMFFLLALIVVGIYIPPVFTRLLQRVAASLDLQ